jgi:hypothetical protein
VDYRTDARGQQLVKFFFISHFFTFSLSQLEQSLKGLSSSFIIFYPASYPFEFQQAVSLLPSSEIVIIPNSYEMKRFISMLLISRVSTSSLYALSVNVRSYSTGIIKKKSIITIRASDVAAIIGQNQYKTSKEVFDEMWKRHSPETFLGQTKQGFFICYLSPIPLFIPLLQSIV